MGSPMKFFVFSNLVPPRALFFSSSHLSSFSLIISQHTARWGQQRRRAQGANRGEEGEKRKSPTYLGERGRWIRKKTQGKKELTREDAPRRPKNTGTEDGDSKIGKKKRGLKVSLDPKWWSTYRPHPLLRNPFSPPL